MVTARQIQKWKNKYDEVFKVPILDTEFYFRPLSREEYREIVTQELPIGEFQEAVCGIGVLWPAGFDFAHGKAGFADTLFDIILDVSGLHVGQAQVILNECRGDMFIFDNLVDCLIHEAFPEYKIEDIKHWTVRKTMWHASRAEYVLQALRGVQLVPIDQQAQRMLETQQKFEQQQQQAAQLSPPKQPKMSPQERAMNSPLARPEEPPVPIQRPQQQPGQPPERVELSEEEAMRMLQQAMSSHPQGGRQIDVRREHNPAGPAEMFPELNWFRAEEELKGEYD
jgi:hypothetical protein